MEINAISRRFLTGIGDTPRGECVQPCCLVELFKDYFCCPKETSTTNSQRISTAIKSFVGKNHLSPKLLNDMLLRLPYKLGQTKSIIICIETLSLHQTYTDTVLKKNNQHNLVSPHKFYVSLLLIKILMKEINLHVRHQLNICYNYFYIYNIWGKICTNIFKLICIL